MKSPFCGSAVIAATILSSAFLLSAKSSVAETLLSSFQKPKQELSQPPTDPGSGAAIPQSTSSISDVSRELVANDEKALAKPAAPTTSETMTAFMDRGAAGTTGSGSTVVNTANGATYTATAYSLLGRTANGMRVNKGLIAADPRVLPLGTRVRLEAGAYSGEYLVADTGASVRGKRIDIWTPNSREANRFGRRMVKLTILSYPVKRGGARHRKP
jgi:3D (Asp-Asp-Asp) domain-containing protein